MGRFGYHVIDADGHGGEFDNWRENVPAEWQPRLAEYRERIAKHYAKLVLPGGGTTRQGRQVRHRAPGMTDPAERLKDMDLEGIDVTVNFPGGAGEEWAMLDRDFAIALCRTMNNAKAEFCRHAPKRLKAIAKLPMIDPPAAAAELRRAVTELGLVGMVTPQHDPRQEPQRSELRRRLGRGRAPRRDRLRARRRPGARPVPDRRRPLQHPPRGARDDAPDRATCWR